MAVLENEFLKVEIEAKGAQLTSVYNKETKTELLWQADSKIWGWHAPNLFPIVGALINDELLVDGEKFTMARHGFGRQSEFTYLGRGTLTIPPTLCGTAKSAKGFSFPPAATRVTMLVVQLGWSLGWCK